MPDEQNYPKDTQAEIYKVLLTEYRGIADFSKREIGWVQSAYKIAAGLIVAVVGAATFVGFRSMSEFMDRQEKSIIVRTKTLEDNLNSSVQSKFLSATSAIEERIDREFRQENVRRLVEEKAQARIDLIADPIIEKKLSSAVQPRIDKADEQLEAVKVELARAQATVRQSESLLEFFSLVQDAQNDDRRAFDKLARLASDKSSPLSSKAEQTWLKIIEQHSQPIYSSYQVNWPKELDPSKLTLKEIERIPVGKDPYLRAALAEYISKRSDYSRHDRMAFLAKLMETDDNLKVVEYAGRFFNLEANLNLGPLSTKQFLEWWEKNESTIK